MTTERKQPHDFARRLGRLAREAGRSESANPYENPGYRAAWLDGWRESGEAADETRPDKERVNGRSRPWVR